MLERVEEAVRTEHEAFGKEGREWFERRLWTGKAKPKIFIGGAKFSNQSWLFLANCARFGNPCSTERKHVYRELTPANPSSLGTVIDSYSFTLLEQTSNSAQHVVRQQAGAVLTSATELLHHSCGREPWEH